MTPANIAIVTPEQLRSMQSDDTIITRDQLCRMLNISDTSRQRLEKSDPHFPPKIHVSLRRVGYRLGDVRIWISRQRELATKHRFAA